MTQFCFIGAKNHKDLKDFHSQLMGLFDNREALKINKEIDFIFQFTLNNNTWCCFITDANILSYNKKDGSEHLNWIGISFLSKCKQQGQICFGVVQVGHKESEDDAIAKLSSQIVCKDIESILKDIPTKANSFYC